MSAFNEMRYPVARKDHRCQWCGGVIPKGEKHAHFVGTWEGDFQNWRMHSDCLNFNEDDIAEGFTPFEGSRPEAQS